MKPDSDSDPFTETLKKVNWEKRRKNQPTYQLLQNLKISFQNKFQFKSSTCQLLDKTVNRTSSIDQVTRAALGRVSIILLSDIKSYENQNQVEKNIVHRQVTKVLISIAGVWMRVSRVWHPVAF